MPLNLTSQRTPLYAELERISKIFLHITTLSPLLQMIRWNISEMITLLLSKYQVCIVDIPIFNTKRFSTIL